MSLTSWIQQNRPLIDGFILSQVDNARIDDDERRLWVINYEPLYCIAFEAGVSL